MDAGWWVDRGDGSGGCGWGDVEVGGGGEGDRGQVWWVGGEGGEELSAAPTATHPAALCPYDPRGHALVIDATTAAFRFFP